MAEQPFTTLLGSGSFELVEKRSRFLAFAEPVSDASTAIDFVAQAKKTYHDSRHVCFAYSLRDGSERYSDDGEPSKTGGFPALQLLNGAQIVDAVVWIVRYFGGVKLGTGGLARAYRSAARGAIEASGTAVIVPKKRRLLSVPYGEWDRFLYVLKNDENVEVIDTTFGSNVDVTIDVVATALPAFEASLVAWTKISMGSDSAI